MKIGYIVHNLNDPAVERRCAMFERGGAEVRLAGFCRESVSSPPISAREPMLLGQSADAAMLQRALSTVKNALLNTKLTAFMADCDVIVARNLEQLAIAHQLVGERALVYECLDIHRTLTGHSSPARLVQAIEAKLLPRVDLLLTSSPGFLRNHFDKRPLRAPSYLIENKLLLDDDFERISKQAEVKHPIVIGWFGMLRCKVTLQFLSDLVERAGGGIKVVISGKPSPAELPNFEEAVERVDGIEYTGPYTYADLPLLYGRCHFAWTIDWFEEGANSSWLLPNRIYEALAHGAVPVGLADIEIGRWLSERNVGLRVVSPEDAMEQLLNLSLEELANLQAAVMQVNARHLVADTSDCEDLIETIVKATRL